MVTKFTQSYQAIGLTALTLLIPTNLSMESGSYSPLHYHCLILSFFGPNSYCPWPWTLIILITPPSLESSVVFLCQTIGPKSNLLHCYNILNNFLFSPDLSGFISHHSSSNLQFIKMYVIALLKCLQLTKTTDPLITVLSIAILSFWNSLLWLFFIHFYLFFKMQTQMSPSLRNMLQLPWKNSALCCSYSF